MINENFRIHPINGCIETIFIVEYQDKILVLDGGCKGAVVNIENYVTKELGRSMDSVKLVIASHAHPDHTGGTHLLKKRHGIPVAAPVDINKWYSGMGGFLQFHIDLFLTSWVAGKNRRPFWSILYKRRIKYDYPLRDGDTLPFFDDWKVMETPGHTAHDIVLYNQRASALYISDMFLRLNGKYILPFPVTLPHLMKKSLLKLKPLKIKNLLMAHGGMRHVEDFSVVITSLLSALKKGLEPFWKILFLLANFPPEIRRMKKMKQNQGINRLQPKRQGHNDRN
jgi:glyoxylase-like metal-dependent hydrolase (beta-lactamase superfamily II)